LAVAAPTHAQSAPPPLTEGPVRVDAGGTPRPTTLLGSERDLDIPFTDLEEVPPVFVNSLGETGIVTASQPGRNAGELDSSARARYGFDVGQLLPARSPDEPNGVLAVTTFTFSYSVTESFVTRETRVGGGVTAQVRVAGLGTPLASATADTAAAAQALAMGQASFAGLRGRILPPIISSTGVTESVSETRRSAITGRDTYAAVYFNFSDAIVGNLGMCDRPFGTCQGGITYDVPDFGVLNVDYHVFQDLYVTTTIERLITATGTVTLDIPLAAYGRAHPAAQVVGFGQSDHFLGRLLAQGAAAPATVGTGRTRLFVEGDRSFGHYRARGAVRRSTQDFTGLRGGVVTEVDGDFSLGLAIEGGHWEWELEDALLPERAEGSAFRGGVFANWTPGGWRVNAAAFVGRQDVDTKASSNAGAGTSTASYHATLYGAGIEAGYPIEAGAVTVTPGVGVTWLGWHAPAVDEAGGLAPLSVDSVTRHQFRPSLGLSIEGGGGPLRLGVRGRAYAVAGDRRGFVTADDGGLSAPGSFGIAGPAEGRWGGEGGAYAAFTIAPDAAISASWSSRFTGNSTSHSGEIGIRIAF
jgi:hypothetical protein